jgi:hypothetical protein
VAKRDPYELSLNDDQLKMLAAWLCRTVQDALDARAVADVEVDYYHRLYEQARTRTAATAPWPDAADLTSYIPSEKVDSLQARLLRAIWTDPIWSVEGWGQAADRAPFLEEFHQWKAEEERLQHVLDRLSLISLIEPRGLLEVSEGTEYRTVRKTINAKVEVDPITGGMVYDPQTLQPKLVTNRDGTFIEAEGPELSAQATVDVPERVRTGPVYRILPYRDSLITPGHARDKQDITGYWKRFTRRYSELLRKAEAGIYEQDAIDRMTTQQDPEPTQGLQRANQTIAPDDSPMAEKELWEGVVLLDLDLLFKQHALSGRLKKEWRGERWYLVTLHLPSQQLLRIQHDDLERSRFVPVILFPRTDRATEGFSFVGHKLITVAEEHTAWRNMAADRGAMEVQTGWKRMVGALWDPYDQPMGPKAVIDVRSMDEVQPIEVPKGTISALEHIQMDERIADRIAGVNDIAAGQVNDESRTLGEVKMASINSEVRMDVIIRRFQEAMEDIGAIRHAIWKRVLAEQKEGITPPQGLVTNLEGRGVSIDAFLPDGKVTAALLEGAFRFKPRGSVETADPNLQRQDYAMLLQVLPQLLMVFPMLTPMFQTPQAAREMGRQLLRILRVQNPQAFLGSPAQQFVQDQAGMIGMLPPGMAPGMPMPGMMPQAPPPMPGPQAPMPPGPQAPVM